MALEESLQAFAARRHGHQEHREKPPTIGERLSRLKAGAYWTAEELTAIKASKGQTVEMRGRAEDALEDIQEYGNDALSHLCLDGIFYNVLRRGRVLTISQLEARMESEGGLSGIIGVVGRKVISDNLASFHQKLGEQQRK